MDMLFPPGSQARIPICAITGTNGKTTTSRMVAHIMKLAGHRVGLASTDGVYIDGDLTVKGDMTGPVAAQMILHDPTIDAAVLETARGGLVRRGDMAYRACDVGAVINVSGDHLGLGGIDTLEQLAEVKRIIVEVATDTAVLNADDELCLKMADYTTAKHLCYVTMNPRHPLVREHIRAGARAVVLEEGLNGQQIVLYDNGRHIPLLWTHLIPATMEGRALHNVQNAMVATAVAYSLGKKLEDIRHGLRTFDLVLPGARPDERVQRAPVQGDPRLRPQPGRGAGHVPAGRAHARARPAGRADHARRPARRGHRRGREDRRRDQVRPLRRQARRQPTRAQARRGAEAARGRPARQRGDAGPDHHDPGRAGGGAGNRAWPSPTISS